MKDIDIVTKRDKTYLIDDPYPDMSVILVCWNNIDYLEPCLDSLYDSDLRYRFDVVVVDNGSTDGSKVIITDTDHIWGIGGDRDWAWKSFTRGLYLIYMDPWDGDVIPETPNIDLPVNMGYILSYANRINLAYMLPGGDLCSTGYCLANPAVNGAEYLVYIPSRGEVTVDLSAASGILNVEWFNPDKGTTTHGSKTNGGAKRSFTPPFSGDAVLYIYQESSPPPPPGFNYIYLPGVFSARKHTDCFSNFN